MTAIDHPPTTDRARIQEALRQSPIMTLATTNIDGSPWATPVGYQADDGLKLHFSSLMGARHVHNLLADDRVSVAIYGLDDDVAIGLQITGRAKLTTNGDEGWQRFTVTRTRSGTTTPALTMTDIGWMRPVAARAAERPLATGPAN